jgi:hypothetical protein
VPLPADTIRAGLVRQYDLNYVAAVLLAVIAWLLTFTGPVMISKLPQADQSTMTDYYSSIPWPRPHAHGPPNHPPPQGKVAPGEPLGSCAGTPV